MSEMKKETEHVLGFTKKEHGKNVPCSVEEMATAAGVDPDNIRVNYATVKSCGQNNGPEKAVEQVHKFARHMFESLLCVQTLMRCAAAGIAIATMKTDDSQGLIERIKATRDHYACLLRRPVDPRPGERSEWSYLHLLGCFLLSLAISVCWWLEWINTQTLALGLTFLNLDATNPEDVRRASALVFVLVVMSPIIAKVYESFLDDVEQWRFRRRVFGMGMISVVLLVLTWGAMAWMNPTKMDVFDSSAGNSTSVQLLMSVFYVLQLSTFAIGTYGLTVCLHKCWLGSRPSVVDESRTQRGSNLVLLSEMAKLRFWLTVRENCEGVKSFLTNLLERVLIDAEIRVASVQRSKNLNASADALKRMEADRNQHLEEFNQRFNNVRKGDNHEA